MEAESSKANPDSRQIFPIFSGPRIESLSPGKQRIQWIDCPPALTPRQCMTKDRLSISASNDTLSSVSIQLEPVESSRWIGSCNVSISLDDCVIRIMLGVKTEERLLSSAADRMFVCHSGELGAIEAGVWG